MRHQAQIQRQHEGRVGNRRRGRCHRCARRRQHHRSVHHDEAVQETKWAVGTSGHEDHARHQDHIQGHLQVGKRNEPPQTRKQHCRQDSHAVRGDDGQQQQIDRHRVLGLFAPQASECQQSKKDRHQQDAEKQRPLQSAAQRFHGIAG
ncbi:MAG: hypothetical protein H6Q33_3440 [Deltaproteobacteria bacterium]|nr:hypothetical protein [Deltaproteobacteria bacterium]